MTLAGSGRAHGAVTVVNAIPAGRGAAIGIDLWTEAEVQLEERSGPVALVAEGADDVDPSLAEACIALVAEHADVRLSGSVTTRSEIPIARGMKSSSVAANAIVLAAIDALGDEADVATILDLSVQAARRAGVTVTGALDDAAASLLGGLVVTDNRADEVVHREPLNTEEPVLLLVPRQRAYTAETGDLGDLRPVSERCMRLVEDDAWREALTLNGLGVAAALGQGLEPTYRALTAGAHAAGTTGTGPAVAALCEEERTTAIRHAWEPATARGASILTATTTDEGPIEGGSA